MDYSQKNKSLPVLTQEVQQAKTVFILVGSTFMNLMAYLEFDHVQIFVYSFAIYMSWISVASEIHHFISNVPGKTCDGYVFSRGFLQGAHT